MVEPNLGLLFPSQWGVEISNECSGDPMAEIEMDKSDIGPYQICLFLPTTCCASMFYVQYARILAS